MSDEQVPPVEPQPDAPKDTPPPTPPPAPPASSSGSGDFGELKTILQGLPESIANAVREALPAPPKQQRQRETKVETPPPAPETPPRKKTFGEKWFGL